MDEFLEQPEEKIERYKEFLRLREEGARGESLARILGQPSAAALYQRLRREGFPVCEECGEYSAALTLCATHLDERRRKQRRRAWGGSEEAEELPIPEGSVVDLFREDVARLERYVDQLPQIRERLNEERFEAYYWVEGDSDLYHRDMYSEEGWLEVCEEYGVDPAKEYFYLPLDPTSMPLGARATPWLGLSRLIAVHILLGGSLEPLIKELHPAPDEVDRHTLNDRLYHEKRGLIAEMNKVVKVVRGGEAKDGKLRRGPSPASVSREEMEAARFVAKLYQEGCSDAKIICKRLKEEGFLDEKGRLAGARFTVEDVRRLRGLKLRPPDL